MVVTDVNIMKKIANDAVIGEQHSSRFDGVENPTETKSVPNRAHLTVRIEIQ